MEHWGGDKKQDGGSECGRQGPNRKIQRKVDNARQTASRAQMEHGTSSLRWQPSQLSLYTTQQFNMDPKAIFFHLACRMPTFSFAQFHPMPKPSRRAARPHCVGHEAHIYHPKKPVATATKGQTHFSGEQVGPEEEEEVFDVGEQSAVPQFLSGGWSGEDTNGF